MNKIYLKEIFILVTYEKDFCRKEFNWKPLSLAGKRIYAGPNLINNTFFFVKKIWEAEATKGDTAMKQETLLKQM